MTADTQPTQKRDLKQSLLRGIKRRCPRCGQAPMFSGYLSVKDQCPNCDLPLHEHRADDAPAWLTILISLHLVVPIILHVSLNYTLSDAVHMVLWPLVAGATALILLPFLKGMVIGFQWAKGMHGFSKG